MNEFKGTPGSWASREYGRMIDGPTEYMVYQDSGEVIHGRIIATTYDYSAEDDANARLIAAAPELLAALQTFAEKYEAHDDEIFGAGLVNGDFFAARKAITKALGGDA